MPTTTINLNLPTFKVSSKAHQRIVAAAALLSAGSDAIGAYGPTFGMPASEGVYVGSGIIVVITILRAMFPSDPPTLAQ